MAKSPSRRASAENGLGNLQPDLDVVLLGIVIFGGRLVSSMCQYGDVGTIIAETAL
jgi:hypothetical protein